MKKLIKIILVIILAVILIAALFLGYLTIREYRPDDISPAELTGEGTITQIPTNEQLKIMSWNIGYGALGKDSDFAMDGGGNAPAADKAQVEENIAGIKEIIEENEPEIAMLQEVDENSMRSHWINQKEKLKFSNYSYAYNHKCDFVPFPWPPFGKVAAGVFTTSDYDMSSSDRYSLPCPFTWPLRVANLKRCLMASRFPTDDGKELVVVNFHLEAYDSGEGKIAQTNMLMEFIQEEYEKGNYVIAGGDWNQAMPGSEDLYPNNHEDLWAVGRIDSETIPEGWNLVYDMTSPTCRLLNQPYDPTDIENTQYYVIDGFICSPNIWVNDIETLNENFEYSDHNPVKAEITLRSES